jgi:hypothetical protein
MISTEEHTFAALRPKNAIFVLLYLVQTLLTITNEPKDLMHKFKIAKILSLILLAPKAVYIQKSNKSTKSQ